jgi:hypothetical protein
VAAPMTAESKRLIKMLADGQWHQVEEVLTRLAAGVPPGKAIRRYLAREEYRQIKEGPRKGSELPESEQIASGQRGLATVALNSLKKNYVDIRDSVDGRMVRLRPEVLTRLGLVPEAPEGEDTPAAEPAQAPTEPVETSTEAQIRPAKPRNGFECPRCWMWVTNPAQHEEFHKLHDDPGNGPPEPLGFINRDELVKIVEEVVERVLERDLNDFQTGMMRFLAGRFADLEIVVTRQRLPLGIGIGGGDAGSRRH